MMKLVRVLGLAVSLLLPTLPQAFAATGELVPNGGFDSADGWSLSRWGTVAGGVLTAESRHSALPVLATATQEITLTPGSYSFSLSGSSFVGNPILSLVSFGIGNADASAGTFFTRLSLLNGAASLVLGPTGSFLSNGVYAESVGSSGWRSFSVTGQFSVTQNYTGHVFVGLTNASVGHVGLTALAVPGPIAGAGLPGLLVLGGWWWRRRRLSFRC